MQKITKAGTTTLPFEAFIAARAELRVSYPGKVLFMRIVEAIDKGKLYDAAFSTLVNGVRQAAKDLGRETEGEGPDEYILPAKET